jgi:hypothetical protein
VTTTPPGVDQLVTKGNKEVVISSLSPIVTQSTFQLRLHVTFRNVTLNNSTISPNVTRQIVNLVIDTKLVKFYTCCKCGHEWTNWDGKQKSEGPIPNNCPSCKNIRWNRKYTKSESELFGQVQMQHIIQKRPDIKFFGYTLCEFDHIAYDFLYMIWPMPEMFELKEILAIPLNKDKIEQRHELMLSIILERIRNKDKYESSRLAKQSKDNELVRKKKDSIYFREKDPKTGLWTTIRNLPVRSDSSVLRIEGCSKHTAEVKDIKDALYSAEKEKRDMQQIKEYGRIWGNWNVYIYPYEHMEFTDRRKGERYKYVCWDVDCKLLNQRIKAVLSLAKEEGYNNNDIESFLREKIPPTDPLDLQSLNYAAGKLNRYLISEEVTNEMTQQS